MTEDGETKYQRIVESALPLGEQFDLVHAHSIPQRCRPLIFISRTNKQLDSVTTHLFIVIHKPPTMGTDSNGSGAYGSRSVAVYALEVLVYESVNTVTLFISKADTSGFYRGSRINMMHLTQQLVRLLLRSFVPTNKRIRIALFAKAQREYLFLGSVDNPQKHVLQDAELVKWWARCLDGLKDEFADGKARCALIVPGLSSADAARHYFPPTPTIPWEVGDVFWEPELGVEAEAAAPAVKRIPRFPDDPKSRFLDSIVVERRAKVMSRKQFWLELQTRQEFLLGKSVGIIGLEADAGVSVSLHDDQSKIGGVPHRLMSRFKEHIVSLKFDTLAHTIEGTQRLLASATDGSVCTLTGKSQPKKRPPTAGSGVGASSAAEIHTLNVVRRKKPKSS